MLASFEVFCCERFYTLGDSIDDKDGIQRTLDLKDFCGRKLSVT